MDSASLRSAVATVLPLADRLFEEIGAGTLDGVGVTRAPFGPGEQVAVDLVSKVARELGLEMNTDATGNVYMSLPGIDSHAPPYLVGSHLDSVPHGGNFDGLAGVIAGLSCVAALVGHGIRPPRSITVMGIRAEENAWFGAQHVGSRLALGSLDPNVLDTTHRFDTGRSLREHIAAAGFDVEPFLRGQRHLHAGRVAAFIELHIEQGPVLESLEIPVGIVTGIRGNLRCMECLCLGAYDHAGTVPKELRKDAVIATAELVVEMEALWAEWLGNARDLVLTFGRLGTDPDTHAVTKIPGEVRFSFDARSHSSEVLTELRKALIDRAGAIGRRRGVTFSFGSFSQGDPAQMDLTLRRQLVTGATELDIAFREMPSGAGHDAADFALAGVPSAMIFVRNANGSHNSAEAMRMEDFAAGVEVLLWLLTRPTQTFPEA